MTMANSEHVLKMGGAGDSPAPSGDPPTGTATCSVAFRPPHGLEPCSRSVRRVAGRNRRVACAARTNAGFTLQTAPAVTGTFTNLPGATSPFTNSPTGLQQFFRLKGE